METNIQILDNQIVATLVGELDTAAAIEMESGLKPLFENQDCDVVIDCTQLEYIASSGLVLRNVNEDIKEVFRLTGFISIFNFE